MGIGTTPSPGTGRDARVQNRQRGSATLETHRPTGRVLGGRAPAVLRVETIAFAFPFFFLLSLVASGRRRPGKAAMQWHRSLPCFFLLLRQAGRRPRLCACRVATCTCRGCCGRVAFPVPRVVRRFGWRRELKVSVIICSSSLDYSGASAWEYQFGVKLMNPPACGVGAAAGLVDLCIWWGLL